MQSNRGFTLIEVLLCLSITIILSSLTMPQMFIKEKSTSIEEQYISIRSLLEEAKTMALLYHQNVELYMHNNELEYRSNNGNRKIVLDKNYYFKNDNQIYFNQNGNINQGNTVLLCNQKECKSLVFNVGSGDFYLK